MSLVGDGKKSMRYWVDQDGQAHIDEPPMVWAREEALEAARLAGTVGDVLGGYHEECVAVGRLAGRVDTLLWAQTELQLLLTSMKQLDRFADTRALDGFLSTVQDSIRLVQDGSGASVAGSAPWAGLVRSVVGESVTEADAPEGVPDV